MLKYKAEVDNKEIEMEIRDELTYSDVETIISTALEFCYDDNGGLIAHFAEFVLETFLVLQVSNAKELGLSNSVESMWKLINENDIVEFIVKSVRYVNYSAMKKAFFAAYNEKLRVAYDPWSSAAKSLAELLNTINANQSSLSKVDLEKLMQLSEVIANKDEGKIVDGILDFHEKKK